MTRGWEVELKDGTIIQEVDMDWRKVPKIEIKRLTLLYDDRRWDLVGRQAYFVQNRASVIPGIKESFQVEERGIGYYEGNKKIRYVISEHTGQFRMEVQET